ncbi:predicted protein [Nematostella vectensis]|uniref:DUF288 domain-containing protein n=1 Tax=Nematostella vectensis TaxID=45351 RepID=A7SA18_NEMVE|nr:predicted protein [Nematostella vectensis]|eukprot:XP_001631546.1 predicted protein [Nematostella vectensis]
MRLREMQLVKGYIWAILAVAMALALFITFYTFSCQDIHRYLTRTDVSVSSDSDSWKAAAQSEFLLADWLNVANHKRLSVDLDWSSIKMKPKPEKSEMNDKWVVITTINYPTDDVKKLAKMDGWKVVVVGDTKTPSDWSHPNCVFLSVKRQKELGYRIADLLPYKSYARKNIGYLYAIQHGAKYIYDTDDDNHPTSGKLEFHDKEKGEYYIYKTSANVVNPYANFGQRTIWPRGYPLQNISAPMVKTFVKCKNVQTSIQQGVVDGDPDVDAIFRLTRKDENVRLDVKFDPKAPPILLPPGTMAPFNSQNTFFLDKGLWALLIPITTKFRVCDIWRGYWGQRLLWEIGGHLSFFPPNAMQYRSAHDYHLDFVDEVDLYNDAGRLVEFLREWKSPRKDFFSRALDLTVSMVDNRFMFPKDAILTEAWLYDLVSIGYKVPSLSPTPKECKEIIQDKVVLEPNEQPSSYLSAGKKLVRVS